MTLPRYASFAIPSLIDIVEGPGGLPLVKIETEFSTAEIFLHGGHIARFVPKGEKPILWMSPASPYQDGKSIRGGMPVCFPWFSAHRTNKDFPIHGCVRFRSWELGSAARLSDGRARVKLVLLSNEATRAFWPYDFKLELTATVGKNLEVELTATNTGADPFRYDDCLHTYFAVGDVRKATVAGLDGIGYIDRINGDIRSVQKGILPIQGEITHVHTRVAGRVEIRDAEWNRKIIIEQAGMDENIVWNPWEATAAKNAEMAGLWKDFLCVESGNCMDGMVVLAPGCSHTSWVRYGAEKLT